MKVCAACGKENQPHYRFCLGCGKELPKGGDEEPPRIQPVPWNPPAPAPEQLRCGYCGMKIPDKSAARCPHCQAPL